jgi:RHS repeat-associated protein
MVSPVADLLASLTNGIDGKTTVAYAPSSTFWTSSDTAWKLPFITQNLSSVTLCDNDNGSSCAGNATTTTYSYTGGYYHASDREFRGFKTVKATQATSGIVATTTYHQGNGGLASESPGYMAGRPTRVDVTDRNGVLRSSGVFTYSADDSLITSYFTPLSQKDDYTYDPSGSSKQVRTTDAYDTYGNLTQRYDYGDYALTTDDRKTTWAYSPNTTAWIVGLPKSEVVATGTGTTVAQSDFYYDGVTACTSAATSQTPILGDLTRVVGLNLSGLPAPETRMAYDAYGNPICTRDANGNTTSFSYDTTSTFQTTVTDALGRQTKRDYYGVGGVAADLGRYGQVKSVTDPNATVMKYEYDLFGRQTKVTTPDLGWRTYAYTSFGTVGSQYILTSTAAGLSSWNYFDGLGRTTLAKQTGPDAKVIRVDTVYNNLGQVTSTTLPYFDGGASIGTTIYTYDEIGRPSQVTHSDGTRTLRCYSLWSTATIDGNNHLRRQTHDAFGRMIQSDEYTGTQTACPSTYPAVYATTAYLYDPLGNLTQVTDGTGNVTTMKYDWLSRKSSMTDPDMGAWKYEYDAAGNLTKQTDAKGQLIYFQYDVLHRLRQKDYGTQKTLGSGDVPYTYDTPVSGYYQIGRLYEVVDVSGTTRFYYDNMGRVAKTDKIVDGVTYTTKNTYDLAGRVSVLTYPDLSSVSYIYKGSSLSEVKYTSSTTTKRMALYANYTPLGQPGDVTYDNLVKTTYTYSNSSNTICSNAHQRLCTLVTKSGTGSTYQNLQYTYDSVGNITAIDDTISGDQRFVYDELNRLTSTTGWYVTITYAYDKIGNMTCNSALSSCSSTSANYTYADVLHKHAVTQAGTTTYTYDANGNMTKRGSDTLTYDYENRLTVYGTTTFVYDGDGGRVKKKAGSVTNLYIGKLYECVGTTCSNYIFAGDQRLVVDPLKNKAIYFYHTDHLGSSSVVTDKAGVVVENLSYYPYGKTQSDIGTVHVTHKYTGQEKDDTGLYFYNARYYDPALGRFISADTIVPDPTNPQALNRYTYVLNNPLLYTDPSGHSWLSEAWEDAWEDGIILQVVGVVAVTVGTVTGCGPCVAVGAAAIDAGVDMANDRPVDVSIGVTVDTGGNVTPWIGGEAGGEGYQIPFEWEPPTTGGLVLPQQSDIQIIAAPPSVVSGRDPGSLTVDATPVANVTPGGCAGGSLNPRCGGGGGGGGGFGGIGRGGGRAPEYPGGYITQSGFSRSMREFLGVGYKEVSPGRYLSADGSRQVRYGSHEIRSAVPHAHFEVYGNGRVIENTRVIITPD